MDGKRAWSLSPVDEQTSARLARELRLHPITARCLVARGLSDEDKATAFLRPRLGDLRPPAGLAGMAEAVDRLCRGVREGERIGLFGDYDVDGVTATAILATFLRQAGATVDARVASRDAGYGFTPGDATALLEAGCRLIVTLDCGTSDLPAVLLGKAGGATVMVVDHHQVPAGAVHPADALVNPHRADSCYPFRGLASAGLAFFLAAATRTALREAGWFQGRPEPDVRDLLDLVAVGTVGDVAPLVEENRVLVTAGLRELSARRRPGLAALLGRAGVESDRPVDETDVGWRIGPRLNAPGRMGEAAAALQLLLATDAADGARLAAACEEANARRRSLQDRAFEEAVEEAARHGSDAVTVVAGPWHPGVVGIVAAKLVERLGRPAAVIAMAEADGEGRGSMRAAAGFHVFRGLERCREHLVRYGGHAGAGGFSVASSEIAALRRELGRAAEEQAQAQGGAAAAGGLEVDAIVELDEVDLRLVSELRSLGPFGAGNREPLLALTGARVRSTRRLGEKGTHLRLVLESPRTGASIPAVGFGLADLDPGCGAEIDIAFRPELSTWQGRERLELHLRDLRPTRGVLS